MWSEQQHRHLTTTPNSNLSQSPPPQLRSDHHDHPHLNTNKQNMSPHKTTKKTEPVTPHPTWSKTSETKSTIKSPRNKKPNHETKIQTQIHHKTPRKTLTPTEMKKIKQKKRKDRTDGAELYLVVLRTAPLNTPPRTTTTWWREVLDVRGGDLKKRGEAVITVERRQRSYNYGCTLSLCFIMIDRLLCIKFHNWNFCSPILHFKLYTKICF
jgi:hypothetical protein